MVETAPAPPTYPVGRLYVAGENALPPYTLPKFARSIKLYSSANSWIFLSLENATILVTRALKFKSGSPRAFWGPAGVPSASRTNRLPSPLGLGARNCEYGRAVAAVNDGATLMAKGS